MFRMSLREILVLVTAIALAIVSLRGASPFWQGVIGLVAMVLIGTAAIAGIFDVGSRRTFAIGAAVAMVSYAVLIAMYRDEVSKVNKELPTSVLLDELRHKLDHSGYVDYAGNDVSSHPKLAQAFDGSYSVNGQPVQYVERPDSIAFFRVGHTWFLL
jgi:hypothetical protein